MCHLRLSASLLGDSAWSEGHLAKGVEATHIDLDSSYSQMRQRSSVVAFETWLRSRERSWVWLGDRWVVGSALPMNSHEDRPYSHNNVRAGTGSRTNQYIPVYAQIHSSAIWKAIVQGRRMDIWNLE